MKPRMMTGWLEIGAGFQLLLAAIVIYAQRDIGVFGLTGSAGVFACTIMIMAACAIFLLHPTRTLRKIRTGLLMFSGFFAAVGAAWLFSAGNFGLAALQSGYAAWLLGASLFPALDPRDASTDDGHARGINIMCGSVLAVIGIDSLMRWTGLAWYDVAALVLVVIVGASLIMIELRGYVRRRRAAMVSAALAFLYVGLKSLATGDWGSGSALLASVALLLLAGLGDISLPEKADDVTRMTSGQLEIHYYERYVEAVVWVSIAFTSAFISFLVAFDATMFFSAIILIAFTIQYFYRMRPAKSTTERRYLQAMLALGVFTLALIASTGGALGPLMYLAFLVIFAVAFVVKPYWPLLFSIFYFSYVLAEMAAHLYVHHDVISDGHLVGFVFVAASLLLTGFFVSLTGYRRQAAESSLVESLKDLNESKSEIEAAGGLNVAVLKALAEGVVAAGQDGIVFRCNPAAAGIIGEPVDKIIGRRLADLMLLYHEGTSDSADPLSSVDARAGRVVAFGDDLVLKRPDGTDVPIEGKASAVMDADGRRIGIVVAMRDAAVERADDKMKSDFISIASHQLRTPVSAMRWLLDMILAGDVGRIGAKQKEFIVDLYSSVTRMAALIDDLLDISRIESGRAKPKFGPIATADFVEALVREFKPMAASRNIDLSFRIGETAGRFRSDPMLAHQVIANLLSNALKYTPEGGSVVLCVDAEGPETVFTVKDDGMGIPGSEQARIFERFFRASNARSIDAAGSGLGLYVAKMITGLLGGRIWFESGGKSGTAFHVSFGGRTTLPEASDRGKISS